MCVDNTWALLLSRQIWSKPLPKRLGDKPKKPQHKNRRTRSEVKLKVF